MGLTAQCLGVPSITIRTCWLKSMRAATATRGRASTREGIVERMSRYLEREFAAGTAPRHVVRHMLGLFQGLRGARHWRRLLSDAAFLDSAGAGSLRLALDRLAEPDPHRRAAA